MTSRTLLCISLLALFINALACAQSVFAFVAEQTVEFQKGVPCTVRIVNDGNEAAPWLLEITPSNGQKATLRLPLHDSNNIQLEEMRAASFISPDKQELFMLFTEVRSGIFGFA